MSTTDTHTRYVAVEDLIPNDLVDLEGDEFADNGDEPDVQFQFEYGVVDEVQRDEGDLVIVVCFANMGDYAFPIGHRVRMGEVGS